MARTDTLGNFLTDVCDAVREKTGETGTIKASELDTKIASIEGGGKYAPRFISFAYITGVTELNDELTNLDTSNITKMTSMFYNAHYIKSLTLSTFNTSNVTDMSSMFFTCSSLTTLDLSSFDTSKVTNMRNMFSNCTNITSIDMSNADTSSVTDMYSMFYNCKKLTFLDIRQFDFTKVTSSYGSMFTNVPVDCEIIVKDDTAKAWVLARRSDFTNVKTVAEYEAV